MSARRLFLIAPFLLLLSLIWLPASPSRADDIANVTIPFSGTITQPEEIRLLMTMKMQTLLADAKQTGVTAIHLQSSAYSLIPTGQGFTVTGNLFIDAVPPQKTTEFVALLNKNGIQAQSNHYQSCASPLSQ